MEVLVGAASEVERQTRAFLDDFERIEIDPAIAERAVAIRKQQKIKLPDAVIQASAETRDMLLVTRNTRDFAQELSFVRVPYVI